MNGERPETVIVPVQGWAPLNLREVYEARYLLWNLVRRNVKVPYVDLSFGVFWTLLRPVLFVFVFFVIKNRSNARMQEGLPYDLFVYSGVILWWYFVTAVTEAARAVYKDKGLITKVYYPRLVTPIVPVLAGTTDFFIQMSLLPLGMLFHGVLPDWRLALLPLVLLNVMALALGLGLLVAALSTESKDYASMMDYVLYIGMFLSPVIFSPEMLSARFHGAYHLFNPMAAPLEMFRAVLFEGPAAPWGYWGLSCLMALGVLTLGAYAFRRVEMRLADSVL